MRCSACNKELTIKEEYANTTEDFINNTVLCGECLTISNITVNEVRKDNEK